MFMLIMNLSMKSQKNLKFLLIAMAVQKLKMLLPQLLKVNHIQQEMATLSLVGI